MSKLTPLEAQEKHARRLVASIEDIKAGVARVTESPTAKAAAKQDKMKSKLVASIDGGKWAAGLKRVSLEEWKNKTLAKSPNRIADGIEGAKDKVVSFYSELFPYQDSAKSELSKMSDVTIEDSVARASFWIRKMNKFKRTK